MKVFETEIAGVKILEVDVHRDARGYFAETYNAGRYAEVGISNVFVQDNESFSQKGCSSTCRADSRTGIWYWKTTRSSPTSATISIILSLSAG